MASNDGFEDGPPGPKRSRVSDGGSGGTTSEPIDPASLSGDIGADIPGGTGGDGDDPYQRDAVGNVKRNKDGSPRRKRGRKAGGPKASAPYDLAASVAMMTTAVAAIHGIVAMATETPEIEVNKSESELLANAIVPLMAHYHVTPPPEVILWTNLFTALAYVEAPRIVLLRMKRAEQHAENAKPVYASTGQPVGMGNGTSYTGGEAPFMQPN